MARDPLKPIGPRLPPIARITAGPDDPEPDPADDEYRDTYPLIPWSFVGVAVFIVLAAVAVVLTVAQGG